MAYNLLQNLRKLESRSASRTFGHAASDTTFRILIVAGSFEFLVPEVSDMTRGRTDLTQFYTF
jgi:hypothetical protein